MNILNKNVNLIAYVLMNLRAPKCAVRQMSKKFRFRRPLDKRRGKRSQTLLKSPQLHLYHFYWSLQRQLSWRKSLLVKSLVANDGTVNFLHQKRLKHAKNLIIGHLKMNSIRNKFLDFKKLVLSDTVGEKIRRFFPRSTISCKWV